ncbi:TetR/AcrR family transcriptional regulator [Ligilactobacillus salivarius]
MIDISNQAHISRRTFYRNFKSKDDVINQYVISLLRKYTDWILQVNPQTYKEVIDDFFTY